MIRHGGLTNHRRPTLTHDTMQFTGNSGFNDLSGSPLNADEGSKLESDSLLFLGYLL